jgi:predicted amidohydrolase YtcJ
MRATLCLSANWTTMGDVPLGPFVEAWLGILGEPGIGDDMLKMSGLYVQPGLTREDEVRAKAGPYTGWAGFSSGHALPHDQVRELLFHCARNDIRPTCITGHNWVEMLDLYEEVDREIPLKGRRWVVSHINVLSPRDIERIVKMGLVLTTQTNGYLYKRLEKTAAGLAPERHADIVPMKSLMEAGVTVAFGSDNTPISLWHPVQQTVLRQALGSDRVFGEAQALSPMEALRCATANGAYLTFDEGKKGTLEPGKFADLAVTSADPLSAPAHQLSEIHALMTMVDGRIVYETPNWSG